MVDRLIDFFCSHCCSRPDGRQNIDKNSSQKDDVVGLDNATRKKWHYYNAMSLVSPSGQVIVNYSKHFLYQTDKTWAEEGPGFVVVDIPRLGGKVLWKKQYPFFSSCNLPK